MNAAYVNTCVRLLDDVPTLWLHRGDVGVVQSVWLSAANYYEVEFRKPGECPVRALLDAALIEQVEHTPVMARESQRNDSDE